MLQLPIKEMNIQNQTDIPTVNPCKVIKKYTAKKSSIIRIPKKNQSNIIQHPKFSKEILASIPTKKIGINTELDKFNKIDNNVTFTEHHDNDLVLDMPLKKHRKVFHLTEFIYCEYHSRGIRVLNNRAIQIKKSNNIQLLFHEEYVSNLCKRKKDIAGMVHVVNCSDKNCSFYFQPIDSCICLSVVQKTGMDLHKNPRFSWFNHLSEYTQKIIMEDNHDFFLFF